MKTLAALTPALLLLAGAGSAQAQVQTAESKLTVSLTFSVETPIPGNNDNTLISRIRFATRDLIALLDEGTGNDSAVRSIVLRRTPVAAPSGIPAGAEFMSHDVTLLDAARAVVATGDAFAQTELDLPNIPGVSTIAEAPIAAVKESVDGTQEVSRRDLFPDGAHWVIDRDGSSGTINDRVVLDLFGLVTANSRRKSVDGDDRGLLLSGWTCPASGGVHIDATIIDQLVDNLTGARDGIVTGTIKGSAERLVALTVGQ